jgi:biopolymer transport protein ExbD
MFLYETPVKNGQDLFERDSKVATRKPQPEVQILGDGAADFEAVGRVMNAVQRAGIAMVSFITVQSGH